jgi:hypothetical protein
MNVDKIEIVYESNASSENFNSVNSVLISGFTKKYDQIDCKIRLVACGDFSIYIFRVQKNLIPEDIFKNLLFCSIHSIKNGLCKDKLKYNQEYNIVRTAQINSRKNILYYKSGTNPTDIESMTDNDILNIKYTAETFSTLLKRIGIYIAIYDANTNTELKSGFEIYNEYCSNINYKKILLQKIFGNYKFTDYTNWDFFITDGNAKSLYFELDDFKYGIQMYTS